MDTNEILNLPNIEEKKALIGGKITYHFMGQKFETFEDAENARNAEAAKRSAELQVQKEKEELMAKQAAVFAKYDEAPEYATWFVVTEPIPDTKNVWGGLLGQKETGLGAYVNLPALNDKIYEVCREASLNGYEVISITPVQSGVGGYRFPGGNTTGGAGWGYSFTQGVTILAKRRS